MAIMALPFTLMFLGLLGAGLAISAAAGRLHQGLTLGFWSIAAYGILLTEYALDLARSDP